MIFQRWLTCEVWETTVVQQRELYQLCSFEAKHDLYREFVWAESTLSPVMTWTKIFTLPYMKSTFSIYKAGLCEILISWALLIFTINFWNKAKMAS